MKLIQAVIVVSEQKKVTETDTLFDNSLSLVSLFDSQAMLIQALAVVSEQKKISE